MKLEGRSQDTKFPMDQPLAEIPGRLVELMKVLTVGVLLARTHLAGYTAYRVERAVLGAPPWRLTG